MACILIIDDDPPFLDMMRTFLERSGHTVQAAGNGREGLRMYAAERPVDLVITDIYMPECDGLETIRELRRKHPEARIIAISGGGNNGYTVPLKYAVDFGADRTLTKPFDLPEMAQIIGELLARESRS